MQTHPGLTTGVKNRLTHLLSSPPPGTYEESLQPAYESLYDLMDHSDSSLVDNKSHNERVRVAIVIVVANEFELRSSSRNREKLSPLDDLIVTPKPRPRWSWCYLL